MLPNCVPAFSFNLLLVKSYVLIHIFCFWIEYKKFHLCVITAKRGKVEQPFADKVFHYELHKFRKYWSNIAVVGAHERLCNQSSVKQSINQSLCNQSSVNQSINHCAINHLSNNQSQLQNKLMLPLNYSRCLLRNIIISQHLFHILYFFYFSDRLFQISIKTSTILIRLDVLILFLLSMKHSC